MDSDSNLVDDLVARIRGHVMLRQQEVEREMPAALAVSLREVGRERSSGESLVKAFELRQSYRLRELCTAGDRDFILNVYRAILRRPPDERGLADFLAALHAGALTRTEIVGRLRYSREGRLHQTRVQGLLLRFISITLYRILWKRTRNSSRER